MDLIEFCVNCDARSRREVWATSKSLAFYSALFFVCNWILAVAFGTRPFKNQDKAFTYGVRRDSSIPSPFPSHLMSVSAFL
jgi:hypothetical protein